MTLHAQFFAGWLAGVLTCFAVVGLVAYGVHFERRRVGGAPAGFDAPGGKVPIYQRRDDAPTEQFPYPTESDPPL